ncbi:MAG: hypothetical protein ACFFD2_13835 [Promethearchaeota archaeon]
MGIGNIWLENIFTDPDVRMQSQEVVIALIILAIIVLIALIDYLFIRNRKLGKRITRLDKETFKLKDNKKKL